MGAAFAYARTKDTVMGDMKVAMGTYASSGGATGGDVVTDLSEIKYFNTDCEVTAAATVHLVTIASGTATLLTVANETGKWLAIGQ